jgi:DUF1009 family protein
MSALGLIAGGGQLPVLIATGARAEGRRLVVLGLRGHADEAALAPFVPHWIRLGEGGRALALSKAAGVTELCMAGRVRRPSLAELRPDWWTLKQLPRLGFLRGGDDAVLQAIAALLAEHDIRIVGPETLLGSKLLLPAGVLGRYQPTAAHQADLNRALTVACALGAVDVGQGAVVQDGLVLAVEAIEGTDSMLNRTAALRRADGGGVLVKAPKPQQDRRLDLPTLGPDTIAAAAAAGLDGVGGVAGGCLVVDLAATICAADQAGLFLVGLDGDAVPT